MTLRFTRNLGLTVAGALYFVALMTGAAIVAALFWLGVGGLIMGLAWVFQRTLWVWPLLIVGCWLQMCWQWAREARS